MNTDLDAALDIYVQAVMARKAEAVVVLDVRGLTSISDAFIICSARSNRQVSAIADHIQRFLREHAIKPLSVEGQGEGHWVLMDYGHVIIHIFYASTRAFYDLEGLWADAPRVIAPSMRRQRTTGDPGFGGSETIVE
jgi:ribosome-associated protein